jgi:hypothetical protein
MAQDLELDPAQVIAVEPVREYDVRGGGGINTPCPGMGKPARPGDSVRPRLVAMRYVLERSGKRPARRALPNGDVRQPRARHVREAARPRLLRRRASVGGRPGSGHRADWPRASRACRVVLRRLHRRRLCPRPRRCRYRWDRSRGWHRALAAAVVRPHRSGLPRQRPGRVRPGSTREHRRDPSLLALLHRARSTTSCGARCCAGTWSLRPRSEVL